MIFETIAVGSFLGVLTLATVMSSRPLTFRRGVLALVLAYPSAGLGAMAALFLRGLL